MPGEPLDGIMTIDEFCPDLKTRPSFRALLADFGIGEQEFDSLMSKWVVYYTQLPEEEDGHTTPREIQLNVNLEPFNRKLTFMHELTHALQYETGKNVVKFKSNSGELENLDELKEYISDPGETQSSRQQLRMLVGDAGMNKEQAWAYMKWGWGMDVPVPPQVESVVRNFFEGLWNEVAEEGHGIGKVRLS